MPFQRLRRVAARLTGAASRTETGARKRPPARPRDAQRARVYRWEAAHVFPVAGEALGLDACRALVEAVFRWAEAVPAGSAPAGWSPPLVTDGRGRRHACGSREVIKLPRWARTRAVVLHECAHGLARDMHGPEFVAAYVALLERFAGLDGAALRRDLAACGVAIAAAYPRHSGAGATLAARPGTARAGCDAPVGNPGRAVEFTPGHRSRCRTACLPEKAR